jgi:hypothetical protein
VGKVLSGLQWSRYGSHSFAFAALSALGDVESLGMVAMLRLSILMSLQDERKNHGQQAAEEGRTDSADADLGRAEDGQDHQPFLVRPNQHLHGSEQ